MTSFSTSIYRNEHCTIKVFQLEFFPCVFWDTDMVFWGAKGGYIHFKMAFLPFSNFRTSPSQLEYIEYFFSDGRWKTESWIES